MVDRDALIAEFSRTHDAWLRSDSDKRSVTAMRADVAIAYFAKHHSTAGVGTVAVGSGLTADQEAFPTERKLEIADQAIDARDQLCNVFYWGDSVEGFEFWRKIAKRLEQIAADFRASAERSKAPQIVEPLSDVFVGTDGGGIWPIVITGWCIKDKLLMTPAESRALAAALLAQADSIEAVAA